MALFFNSVGQYKSSWYETARILFRSRHNQRTRAERMAEENRELRLRIAPFQQESQATRIQLEQTNQLLQKQQQADEELRQQPITLPNDLALPNHT
jgi:cell shape-determining protein MreC